MSNVNNSGCASSSICNGINVSKPVQSILGVTGTTTSSLIEEYVQTLNDFERKGLAIAKDHLGPSFDMKRSSGFLRWKDAKSKK
jgi:hypothetical protein